MRAYLTGSIGLFFHTVQEIMDVPILAFFLFLLVVMVVLGIFMLLAACFGGCRQSDWR